MFGWYEANAIHLILRSIQPWYESWYYFRSILGSYCMRLVLLHVIPVLVGSIIHMMSLNLMLKTYISLFESIEFGPKINCHTHNNHMGGCQTHQPPTPLQTFQKAKR